MSLSVTRGLDMAVAGSWQPPRPCEVYRSEWELCRSARHILHHYYVHGERPDCRQWLRDLASCREWEESRSPEAQALDGYAWCLWEAPGHSGQGSHWPGHHVHPHQAAE
ncbi:UPF0545 protein C22orf39 homolog isoform X2 [Cricetulus griseus]|uniref:Synaptic plasticity regulator PANTS n=1 Tax=Cricetulus griseus TaxID=10029 RepID=A0A9J7GX56_CRIGR|nr:UPF0545 protein C22orf39 homolog isoform X2 [Cricetulus griseus]